VADAGGGDPGAFRVDPKQIAESITLKQEVERLKKDNAELREQIKKKANGRGGGWGTGEENVVVEITKGSDVTPVAVRWLWKGWLAFRKLEILAGAKGTLKTTIAITWAACVTAAGNWPDGTKAEKGDVLIWSGEDDFDDTILPRFLAAGGDPNHLYYVNDAYVDGKRRPFDPARDMDKLIEAAKAIPNLVLVIIDSVVSVVTGDSHKNAETRRGLAPLRYFASETNCCVLGLTHFTKNTRGNDPIERITGSLAFGALPRVAMVTAKPIAADLKHRIVRAASNIGPDGGGFEYSAYQQPLPEYNNLPAQRIAWGDWLEGSALDLLNDVELPKSDETAPRLSAAAQFLKTVLAEGPMPVARLREEADAAGHSWITVRRAQDELGITSEKDGFSVGWAWRLPNDVPPGGETDL
jgi:hypothetical protein